MRVVPAQARNRPSHDAAKSERRPAGRAPLAASCECEGAAVGIAPAATTHGHGEILLRMRPAGTAHPGKSAATFGFKRRDSSCLRTEERGAIVAFFAAGRLLPQGGRLQQIE
jgi:cellulase/cellobiase CelA1